MKKEPLTCESPNFIRGEYLDDISLCDTFIRYFHAYPGLHNKGMSSDNKGNKIYDPSIKESTDITFNPDCQINFWKNYCRNLQKIAARYIEEFPYCDKFAPWGILEPVNLQYYPPGGGYKQFHTERNNGELPTALRHLVFMTYLNDVNDNGGTEFLHQKLTVKPKKGLTLFWPSDWTYTHRGISSDTEGKYILTGWFSFIPSYNQY